MDLHGLRKAEAATLAALRSGHLQRAWAAFGLVALLIGWTALRWSPAAAPAPATVSDARADDAAAASTSTPAPVASVDLVETAAVCTAIARLESDADLHPLLERTGHLLGASGVVLWMAAGEELFAAAGHGYDPAVLRRLGPIPRGADNATAAAWRAGHVITVGGGPAARGAIVAPMLAPHRCIGVLAVEVTPGAEADVAAQSVAALIAAQLSAVVTAWPAGSSAPADLLAFERAAGASS
jgi:hypothetical protein